MEISNWRTYLLPFEVAIITKQPLHVINKAIESREIPTFEDNKIEQLDALIYFTKLLHDSAIMVEQ